jgi:RNA polymerase sigma factor (sigma-70 family)
VKDFDRSALLQPTLEVVCAVAYSYLPEALRRRRLPIHDVEDLIQDVVLVAQRKLGGFQTDEQDPLDALRAWLWSIAWRQARNLRGRGHGRHEVLGEDLTEFIDDGPDSEELMACAERSKLAITILGKLRPERAAPLTMHYAQEMTVPAIADALEVNASTVASRIHRGRDDFRRHAKRHTATGKATTVQR